MPTSRKSVTRRTRHRFRWRACSSSARHRLRRNGVRGLGRAGRATHRRGRCSTTRCRRCSAYRCGCARRVAPTPVCTPPVRSHTSTFRPMRCRTPTRARRGAGDSEFLPLVRRLARFLPDDVRVLDIDRAAAGFDARFSALRRHYVYRLSTAPYGVEPQQARYVTAWPRPLDVDAMAAASRDLVGLHDFAAFCRQREGATTIRDLQRLDWSRDGDRVTAYVSADAFCWSMVRSLVGALVGRRRAPPRTRLVRHAVDVDAALQRLRGRAAARPHARRRRLPAR